MLGSDKKALALIFILLLGFFQVISQRSAFSATCADGRGEPPFLGQVTIDPNVLLMLDNSASMLDLVAVGAEGICYDGTDATTGAESYDSNTDYGGYFRPIIGSGNNISLEDSWYVYDTSTGQFEKSNSVGADNHCTGVSGTKFSHTDVCVTMVNGAAAGNPPDYEEVTSFAARGNFLNWAAASKLDIQKKVLTGGKYENSELILESRGCLNHKYVKKVAVNNEVDPDEPYFLTLGIRPPSEWQNDKAYLAQSVVVYPPGCRDSDNCKGYYAPNDISVGTTPGSGDWQERDYSDLTQIEIFEVTTSGVQIEACQAAIEEMASESPNLGQIKQDIQSCLEAVGVPTTLEGASNAIFNQSTQDCWFMTKHSDLWDYMDDELDTISTENMTNIRNGCKIVYDELEEAGMTPTDIESTDTGYACYGYNQETTNAEGETVIQRVGYVGRCWDLGGVITCTDESCDGQPETGASEICVDRNGDGTEEVYYCPGSYSGNPKQCVGGSGNNKYVIEEEDWPKRVDCVGDASEPSGWDSTLSDSPAGGNNELHGCIQQAIEDYCGYYTTSEVIDPSDAEGSVSGDYYNIPAILIETATEAQLDDPLLTMNGRISRSAPTGILHEYDDLFRFGAMAFNYQGQGTECGTDDTDPVVNKICENTLDGAHLISYMEKRDFDLDEELISAINAIKGSTWTPLAEAMYTAIGYFSQDDTMRLNAGDFEVEDDVVSVSAYSSAGPYVKGDQVTGSDGNIYVFNSNTCEADCPDPVSDKLTWTQLPAVLDPIEPDAYCQSNNVLFITEGASTVDLNDSVETFVSSHNDSDDDSASCGRFSGSSYLDDLAWYGWQGNMWSNISGKENYSNIRSWIVESATRDLSGLADECQPDELLADASVNGSLSQGVSTPKFQATNELEFYRAIKEAFETILDRVSSGSAASVISASRSGEGALYQAIFWPATDSGLTDADDEKIYVKWTGQVHAFFVDSDGQLREDTDQNGALDVTVDEVIVVYYDTTTGRTRACYGTVDPTTGCSGEIKELSEINYLWNVANWLNNPDIDDPVNITLNRPLAGVDNDVQVFDDDNPKRYIFTWDDLNNDGVVDQNSEVLPFEKYFGDTTNPYEFPSAETGTNRGEIFIDFGINPLGEDINNDGLLSASEDDNCNGILDAGEDDNSNGVLDINEDIDCDGLLDSWEGVTNNIIDWIRGKDIYGLRSRKMNLGLDLNNDGSDDDTYWKLGDVIYSTPITVAGPAENYHQLYRDESYGEFAQRWGQRRHVVYFGGNDGMLHAVNGGFFIRGSSQFCRKVDSTGQNCDADVSDTPVLGEELWAYVPYNLLPHLSCLTDPNYEHKYYVDLRPRVFDAQIFTPETACNDGEAVPTPYADGCIHPNGWGTILVGGMRFGGSEVRPGYWEDSDGDKVLDVDEDLNGNNILDYDNRDFTSAYFIFDITNPEKLPRLLGEFTRTVEPDGTSSEVELGYTTVISTLAPMQDGTNPSEWSLILGSGPTELDGTSDQAARLGIVPLHDRMNPNSLKSMRIPAAEPVSDLIDSSNPDFGTIQIPDAETDSFVSDIITVDLETLPNYMADVVYFGTVSGDFGTGWGGKMFRLVTRSDGASGIFEQGVNQVLTKPHEWPTLLDFDSLDNPNVLYNPGQPIVSPATVGTDGINFWVYFGTGRFFHVDDKTDAGSNDMQTFYGIREPIKCSGTPAINYGGLNWETVDNTVVPAGPPLASDPRGTLGLMPVENIAIRLLNEVDTDGDGFLDPGEDLNSNGIWDIVSNVRETTPGVVGCYAIDGSFDPDIINCVAGLPVDHPLRTNGSFNDLQEYIIGLDVQCWEGLSPGFDGWSRDLLSSGERNLGQATLLSGLLSFSSYIPNTDICEPEGSGNLYGVYYQTGTSWFQDVFGRSPAAYNAPISEKMFLGLGLSTTPNIHVGQKEGSKAFIQTSVGQIVEIPQPNLPIKNVKSGMIKWRDIEQ